MNEPSTVLTVVARGDFRYLAIEFGVTLLLLFAFALDLARRREPAAAFVLGSVGLSFAGGVVQWLGLRPHPQFNDNDLFHVLQAGATWFLFRGALLLRGR